MKLTFGILAARRQENIWWNHLPHLSWLASLSSSHISSPSQPSNGGDAFPSIDIYFQGQHSCFSEMGSPALCCMTKDFPFPFFMRLTALRSLGKAAWCIHEPCMYVMLMWWAMDWSAVCRIKMWFYKPFQSIDIHRGAKYSVKQPVVGQFIELWIDSKMTHSLLINSLQIFLPSYETVYLHKASILSTINTVYPIFFKGKNILNKENITCRFLLYNAIYTLHFIFKVCVSELHLIKGWLYLLFSKITSVCNSYPCWLWAIHILVSVEPENSYTRSRVNLWIL